MRSFKLGWFHSVSPTHTQGRQRPRHQFFATHTCNVLSSPAPPMMGPRGCLDHSYFSGSQHGPSLGLYLSWGGRLSYKGGPRVHKAFSLPENTILSFLQGHSSKTIWFELPWFGKFEVGASLLPTWRPNQSPRMVATGVRRQREGAQTEERVRKNKGGKECLISRHSTALYSGETNISKSDVFLPSSPFHSTRIY